jgi:dihydroorotate dehydrogenase
MILIGVGGVMDLETARAKFEAGADLIQVYTGFVYGGPSFPRQIVSGLGRG